MSEEKTVHCVTCCQALPAGMEHPEFFGQSRIAPDSTEVSGVYDDLAFILQDLQTVSEALREIYCDKSQLPFALSHLLVQLTEEAGRRAIRLRNAGLYWQGVDRNDDSLFPDLPPPPAGRNRERQDDRAEED